MSADGSETAGSTAPPEAALDAAADGSDLEGDLEGPRRRARRERAERRAVQQRAVAIEEARREAKRRARGQDGSEPPREAARNIKGLKLFLWTTLLVVLSVALGLVLYFTPLMSARSLVIIGTGVVPSEEVVAAAAIKLGTPLLQINTDQVADRIAGIRRVIPPRCGSPSPSESRWRSKTSRTGRTCSTGTGWTSSQRRRRRGWPTSMSPTRDRPTRRLDLLLR
jgi:cell division protein FtsQ